MRNAEGGWKEVTTDKKSFGAFGGDQAEELLKTILLSVEIRDEKAPCQRSLLLVFLLHPPCFNWGSSLLCSAGHVSTVQRVRPERG